MTTWTWQPDATDGVDADINNGIPTTNTGTEPLMFIGEGNSNAFTARSLIKPDFTKGTNPISANAAFTSLSLELTAVSDFSSNARTVSAYRQLKAWTEAGVTWNKYDGTNNWTTAGGFSASDCEQTAVGSGSQPVSPATGDKITITFTNISAINDMVKGTFTNNGFLLKVDTELDDQIRYATSDSGTASYRPKWTGEWAVISGTQVIIMA